MSGPGLIFNEGAFINDVTPKRDLGKYVVHTFHSILDHFIQPLINGIIHVVPFWDLTLLSFFIHDE